MGIKVNIVTKIGEFHLDHNEDNYALYEIGEDKILFAVMDGCSMGIESHFASSLTRKILKKISKEYLYKEFISKQSQNLKSLLKNTVKELFYNLIEIKNNLGLERDELLSTLILGIFDSSENIAKIIIIGDGLISYNKELIEYDNDNKPDYLGYHLGEDFNKWFEKQNQILDLKNINDLSICTDGIFTFKKFDNEDYPEISENEIIEFLLTNRIGVENNKKMLFKKLLELEKKWGLKPTDDLTIIRLINT